MTFPDFLRDHEDLQVIRKLWMKNYDKISLDPFSWLLLSSAVCLPMEKS